MPHDDHDCQIVVGQAVAGLIRFKIIVRELKTGA